MSSRPPTEAARRSNLDSLVQAAARAEHDSILAQPVGVLALEAVRLFDIFAGTVGVAQRDSRLRAADQRLHFARGRAFALGEGERLGEAGLGLAHAGLVALRRRFGRAGRRRFELAEQDGLAEHEPRD